MAHLKATTYDGLMALTEGKRYGTLDKIGHNTWAMRLLDNERVQVKLHSTWIAVLSEDEITLDTKGWQTPTTRDRLNQLVRPYGYWIYQRDHAWYVHKIGQPAWGPSYDTPFEEGMTLKRF